MSHKYNIPMKFKAGNYVFRNLPSDSDNSLCLLHTDYGYISYNDDDIRIYRVNEEFLDNLLYAEYDAAGMLRYIRLEQNGGQRLVYIGYTDDNDAREKIRELAQKNGETISDELIMFMDKAARLFVEHFSDGQAFDFSAKIGTPEQLQAVAQSSGSTDNSGDYPDDNRVKCDNETFSIMFSCARHEIYGELVKLAVDTMTEIIKDTVIDILDKTDDFKFIVSEYD